MDSTEIRTRVGEARVARLATVGADGAPHLVPVTFAVLGEAVVTAVDHKPKVTTDLRRLRNIRHNPQVSILVDHYEEDWTRLWWVRGDGTAVVHSDGPAWQDAVTALTGRYPQYRQRPPRGPAIVITISRWSGWAYSG
ncbi:TIGR03668 family PPOX class F420-dependent oxidoreductase [Nonomuraea jiangxiensis]|uniref:PPOX class probable F420-dependent enzyme, Rv0121 family n=1 Tax=Nonomuraea jiangxiensis TaxID=633440 RepID=A0A1G8BNB4_9ACTN|nr:TIGR03668 family PPOX class F420-dependent oxidoreductase [Nonomuraea jiangxiensis]SDH34709.1 PPOX class probable F420-dependent enzyme, Rv0121 family [Nonomuraea jiangxiensis]